METTWIITQSVAREMLDAARAVAPLEACGLLGGTGTRVTRCHTLTNMDASPEHYSMKPEEQFAAVKDLRTAGLALLGLWHSHPASPARMSEEDLRLAYTPEVAYVILSLAEPGNPRIKAFVVENGVAREMTVKIEEKEDQS